MDKQGDELKAIVSTGVKIGGSLTMAEHIPWLRWMFPLKEEAFTKNGDRRDRLSRAIMEEHTLARQNSGGAKQHFVDALLTLQDKYDLSEDTIIGLLWGHDFRLLPFGAGRRVCPGAQLAINLVTSMLGHLLHHFTWTPPEGVKPEDMDMSENPGLATYMRTPLQAVAIPRLPLQLYKRVAVDI
ncbi:hypothetical protein Q3G72_034587 [Acer saccharum]|nr:hypothetical protein Q3G72_034587 [Acer saccharum]